MVSEIDQGIRQVLSEKFPCQIDGGNHMILRMIGGVNDISVPNGVNMTSNLVMQHLMSIVTPSIFSRLTIVFHSRQNIRLDYASIG